MRYKRVLLKLSGGALAGEAGFGFSPTSLEHIANELLSLTEMGVQVAVVVGGGNIFRGNMGEQWGIERAEADSIGTLATVVNSLMLRGVLTSKTDREVRVMTSIPIHDVAEPYIRLRAIHHLDKGYIVIFAGGNGQPYVTTDYPSVQRAIETRCEAILVAKHGVDGVYESDPKKYPQARKYRTLSYQDVISTNIHVMDQASVLLARDHQLPMYVFNFESQGSMKKVCAGEDLGTVISQGPSSLVGS
ncbi:UMP kinase [Alicyclobacillus ferrooxydans]|uniref:Uridylate kinase n=1 Tax=Alicyclobacillus ferrooxydans TaxID=471514 RepID=A0A0P9D457_9BACL|nr:UMP kinase [Alicyclobacillus ferrooxydans]KPV44272.1 uridylate kinase [Alicyclobacillus ferrooxydans]